MAKKKRGRPKKSKDINIKSEETRIFAGLILGFLGLLGLLSHFVSGEMFEVLKSIIGIGSIPAGITLLLLGSNLIGWSSKINDKRTLIGMTIISFLISTLAHFIIPIADGRDIALDGGGGGIIGYVSSKILVDTFGRFASVIFMIILGVVGFSLMSGVTLKQIAKFFKSILSTDKSSEEEKDAIQQQADGMFISNINDKPLTEAKESADDDEIETPSTAEEDPDIPALETDSADDSDSDDTDEDGDDEEEIKYPNWKLPSADLLSEPKPVEVDESQHEEKSKLIEKTLQSFGIHAKVSDILVGPRVVQYALSITVGTKVSKVKSLGNDLALALAAPSGSVRIEAPIPGTSLIGIEVPNPQPTMVTLGELVKSDSMKDSKIGLPVILGKDISGKNIVRDLTKMPHLLIAGATGSGKSICINSIICGMLMKHSPDTVKFILVDPKMVELPPYNGIPHLLTPVITDVEKVVHSLDWLVTEMQKRFRILNKAKLRNIKQYNDKMGHSAMPYIILVVDEMADLMLSTGVDVESKIVRLAQMARAVGIHLVLATQRPSVDVLTGLIKANIPARVGMSVATVVDSRVILDMSGAENLLGNGDMLFKTPEIGRPLRIQGSFVSNEEVEKITKFVKSQVEDVDYNNNVTKPTQEEDTPKEGIKQLSEDELFPDAVRTVVNANKASSSFLQRKLRIGYNRAARILDELHAAKIVGPQKGSKPRDVLISDADSFLQKVSQDNED